MNIPVPSWLLPEPCTVIHVQGAPLLLQGACGTSRRNENLIPSVRRANTRAWVLDFEPEAPRQVEPLMGWTSSGDMRQQLRLRFDNKEGAIAYCERRGIP